MILISLLGILPFVGTTQAFGDPFPTLSVDNSTNRQIIFDIHNKFRRNVFPTATNMLKMMWNDEANKIAEKWAKQCSQKHSPPETRRITNFGCGENLYMSSYPAAWEEVITSLHSEIKNFEYGKGARPPGAVIGHYTQIVWYNSYLIGASVAYCPGAKYKYFYVLNYCPAGNISGKMATPYKPGPTCADCPKSCENGLCTNYCPYSNSLSNCQELKDKHGCASSFISENCAASCRCVNNEII